MGTNGGLGKAAGGDTGWGHSLRVWGGLNQTGQWFSVGGKGFSVSKEFCIKMMCPSLPLCFRSGKRIKKTRKYDIITTPAERVEMAPLNEEDDEDEDSTVFDVKYRYYCEPIWLDLLTELLLVKIALFFSAGPARQRWGSDSLTLPKHYCSPLQPFCLFAAHVAPYSPALVLTTLLPLGCLPSSFLCRAAQQETCVPDISQGLTDWTSPLGQLLAVVPVRFSWLHTHWMKGCRSGAAFPSTAFALSLGGKRQWISTNLWVYTRVLSCCSVTERGLWSLADVVSGYPLATNFL